ncbi:MAG: bifunctional DNA-formamidopyrimidine glycosylase/DNA-(apurinic or apyrimidinic site) lyase [Candidatus Saccharibacteria bacterium]|nr:bifunctional DNA-formamidopyrimidine glycosylase/DNA-(apurinic or apyrimidinic site) lyase [Candidatus Saccharibacteria bacterium]
MPELPEVEVIRRGLSERIIGRKVRRVEVLSSKNFIGPEQVLVGKEIIGVRRFGKVLVLDFSEGISMMIHLRMTGQIVIRGGFHGEFAGGHPSEGFVDELPNKQTRVIFVLDEGKMFFNDQRKFGFCKVIPTAEVMEDEFIRKLGPEPWNISAEDFYKKLQRHQAAPIKAVILDQKIIAGVGNIYADESLFLSGIYPGEKAGNVSFSEAEKLLLAIREVMDKSIESGGSTMKNYVKADGTRGDYLKLFANVFRREGESCPRCGEEILKIRIAGRGTHFCPKCQEKKMELENSEGIFQRGESGEHGEMR